MLPIRHHCQESHVANLPQPEDAGRGHCRRLLCYSARSATRDVERPDKLRAELVLRCHGLNNAALQHVYRAIPSSLV